MSSFAALEQRLNRAVTRRVSNASVQWRAGGWAGPDAVAGIRVVFDREGGAALDGGVSDFNPVISAYEGDMPGARRGDVVEVTPDTTSAAVLYEVVRAVPDGTGLLVLHLMAEGAL